MSSSDDYQSPAPDTNALTYGVVLSIGVLTLIIIVAMAKYLYNSRLPPPHRPSPIVATSGRNSVADEIEFALLQYPLFKYSETKIIHSNPAAAVAAATSCCSICLAEYQDTDLIRLLPDCGHQFHQKCVDFWLRRNHSCPVCRKSPSLISFLPTIPRPEVAISVVPANGLDR